LLELKEALVLIDPSLSAFGKIAQTARDGRGPAHERGHRGAEQDLPTLASLSHQCGLIDGGSQ
jgi:hypothetical protein